MKKLEQYKPFPYVAWFLVVSFALITLALTVRANEITEALAMGGVM